MLGPRESGGFLGVEVSHAQTVGGFRTVRRLQTCHEYDAIDYLTAE